MPRRVVRGRRGRQVEGARTAGAWTLHEHVGSGGMGSVWRATTADGRTAAVKLIRSDLRDDPEARRRFRREFDVARRVTSRRVAVPLDADLDCDPAFIAWEYVVGDTLQARIAAAGPLREDEVVTFARDLAEALRDLEVAGITHRDVKPNNILLSATGAILVDLGVALVEDQTGLTTGGQVIGTPGWLTPEQLEGARPTAASDVFNWAGAVVFAAAGRGPFGTDTLPKLMYRVAHEPPDLDGVPAPIRRNVELALSKDPTARPTARTIAAELNAILDGSAAGDDGVTVPDASATVQVGAATRTLDTAAVPAGELATSLSGTAGPVGRRRPWLIASAAAALLVGALAVGLTRVGADNLAAGAAPSPSPTVELVSSPPPAPVETPTPRPARPAADRLDPASYYTADGTAPALTPDCPGVIGLCLGNPIERAIERLGTEDSRYDLDGEVSHTWDLGAVTVSATADGVGSIIELDVGTRSGARASTPLSRVTVGATTFREFANAVGGPHFVDVLSGEGFTVVYFGVLSGSEGHQVEQVSTSLDFSDRDWERVWDAGHDVKMLLDILGDRTIDSYQIGYEWPESAAWAEAGSVDTAPATDDGEFGVPPSWVHDALAGARGGFEMVDGSTWDPKADINVVTGSMAGGATGRGMYAFFFAADLGYIGTDAIDASETLGISWRDATTVAIEYVLYREDDPGCCPTGGSAVVRFFWDGERLSPLDEIPPTSGPLRR